MSGSETTPAERAVAPAQSGRVIDGEDMPGPHLAPERLPELPSA